MRLFLLLFFGISICIDTLSQSLVDRADTLFHYKKYNQAARGTGYALESSKWNNGVFTFALLEGLKKGRADVDSNGTVQLTELSYNVSREVELLTNGNQKPTSRAENLEYDWVVW